MKKSNDSKAMQAKKEQEYYAGYEKKRSVEQSRLPTCYISKELKADLVRLAEKYDLQMKDVMVSGLTILLEIEEIEKSIDHLFVKKKQRVSNREVETELKNKIKSYLNEE